jgi:hypothetical protein
MATIVVMADLPDELVETWLTNLRAFDRANPECHFEVLAQSELHTVKETVEMMDRLGVPVMNVMRKHQED